MASARDRSPSRGRSSGRTFGGTAGGGGGASLTHAQEVTADSALGFWRLNEAAYDSANGPAWAYTTTAVNRTALIADSGNAKAGSGSAAICSIATTPTGMGGASVSVGFVVNIPAGNVNGPIVTLGTSTAGWSIGVGGSTFDNAGKQLIILNANVGWSATGITLTTGIHKVVVTRSAANLFTVYVDGTSGYTTTIAAATATGVSIGAEPGSGRYLASTVDVDDVALYPSVLSGAQVTAQAAASDATLAATILAASPVAFLKLDETAYATLADSSGNARNGTLGAITLAQPSLLGSGFGTAALYGSPGYSSIAYASWMNAGSSISAEARVKPVSGSLTGIRPVIGRWTGNLAGNVFWFGLNGGKVCAQVGYGASVSTLLSGSTSLVAGTTYTLGFSYNGTTLLVYVNGVQDGTLSTSGTVTAPTSGDMEIGRIAAETGAFYGNMTVDEVSFMGSTLSAGRFLTRHTAAVAA